MRVFDVLFFCLHVHMHHMFILHFPRGSETMGLPQQRGSKSGLNTHLGCTQSHNCTKIYSPLLIYPVRENLMLSMLTFSQNPEKFPRFCVLVVAMSAWQSLEPQQYTYIHIATCLHLLFQIAVKLPPAKWLCQSDRFFHPLYLHGSRLLCTWVIPKGSSTPFWPPETHGTLEDKVRKNRQQLHLRAGAVKVAAKFEAMWKWQKRKSRSRMRAHLALVQLIIKECKEEDCKQYKNNKFIQNQLTT